jgi:hypothetical protein
VETLKNEEVEINSQAKEELEQDMQNYEKNTGGEYNNLSKEILKDKLTKEVIANEIKSIKDSNITKLIETKE